MATAQLETPMARTKRNDIPVKMDAEVIRVARIVAAYRDIPLAEYISERLRPLAVADLAQHQQEGDSPPAPRRRKKPDAD